MKSWQRGLSYFRITISQQTRDCLLGASAAELELHVCSVTQWLELGAERQPVGGSNPPRASRTAKDHEQDFPGMGL